MRLRAGSRGVELVVTAADDVPTCICHLWISQRHGLPRGVRIRIERPRHLAQSDVPEGHSKHAHVERLVRGNWHEVYAINKDGTGSHDTKTGTVIDAQVATVLRSRGFEIPEDNLVRFLSPWHVRWISRILVRAQLERRPAVVILELVPTEYDVPFAGLPDLFPK